MTHNTQREAHANIRTYSEITKIYCDLSPHLQIQSELHIDPCSVVSTFYFLRHEWQQIKSMMCNVQPDCVSYPSIILLENQIGQGFLIQLIDGMKIMSLSCEQLR